MTAPEFGRFMVELAGSFAGELAPERAAAIEKTCAGWRYDDAVRALERLVAEGTSWLPTPGDLVVAVQRANGGVGSLRARAALAGLTPDELYERSQQAFLDRLAADERGAVAREHRRELERRRRGDLTRTNFRGLLEAGRPGDDGESAA